MSRASAHGRSQLKHQKRRWAVTRRKSLNGSTIPEQGATPNAKLAARGYEIDLHRRSSVLHRRQPDSRESCIVLQSELTRSLIAKFPQCLVVTWNTQILCCRGRTLQTRLRMDVCEPLMSDVVAPKVSATDQSQLCDLSGPTFGFTT